MALLFPGLELNLSFLPLSTIMDLLRSIGFWLSSFRWPSVCPLELPFLQTFCLLLILEKSERDTALYAYSDVKINVYG